MTTNLGNSTHEIDLASYPDGNPFDVGSGTRIVTSSGSGIYGGTGQTWTLTNAGKIESTAEYAFGIDLHAGCLVTNQGSGLIEGFSAGIYVAGGSGTILNEGTIKGTGRGAAGADFSLLQTQTVTNLGLIEGTRSGITLFEPLSGMAASGAANPATIVNQAGGTLAGGRYGLSVGVSGVASVSNAGTIEGGQDGIALFMRLGVLGSSAASPSGGGVIGNAAGGVISGGRYGIAEGAGGAAVITNDGSISGGTSGISLFMGRGFVASSAGNPAGQGSVSNQASGTITGGVYGMVEGTGADGTITNAGHIEGGRAGISLFMRSGFAASAAAKPVQTGVLTNLSGGEISGGRDGIILGSTVTVMNHGTIAAEDAGGIGIDFTGAGNQTLIDSGVILGPGGAVRFGAGNDLLVVEPGARFSGTVDGGGGTNTLELGVTGGPQTLVGFGLASFTHFQHLTIDDGGKWILAGPERIGAGAQVYDEGSLTLSGSATLAGTIGGAGTLIFSGGTETLASGVGIGVATWSLGAMASAVVATDLVYGGGFRAAATSLITIESGDELTLNGTASISGSCAGTGTLGIGAASRVALHGMVGGGLTLAFGSPGGVLAIGDPTGFAAAISGFAAGDGIDVTAPGFGYGRGDSVTFVQNGTTGTLTLTVGSQSLNLTLFGQYVVGGFEIAADGHGGTLITYTPPPLRLVSGAH